MAQLVKQTLLLPHRRAGGLLSPIKLKGSASTDCRYDFNIVGGGLPLPLSKYNKIAKFVFSQNYPIIYFKIQMKQSLFKKLTPILYPLASIAFMLLVWHLMFLRVGSEFVFPSIGATLQSIWQYLCDGAFWLSLLSTLGRVLICFAISLVLAIAIGVLAKFVPIVGKILAPVVALFRSAPTVAVMVILILFIKKPAVVPVIVGLLVVFPMLYASVTASIDQVDKGLVEMCTLYNVPKREQLKTVYLPTITPYLLGELPATLSLTVKLIISAEILAYSYQSIGGLIQSANVYSEMASLFALTLLSVGFATLLDGALRLLSKFVGGGAR